MYTLTVFTKYARVEYPAMDYNMVLEKLKLFDKDIKYELKKI